MVAMPDGAMLRTWTSGLTGSSTAPPVILVHGGPGMPNYMDPVARCLSGRFVVHQYDQRGCGGSPWDGMHTIERHVADLEALIDRWGAVAPILIGHSFGADLVSYFMLAHPTAVASVVFLAGPRLGPWRSEEKRAKNARLTADQNLLLSKLESLISRSPDEELTYLALSWVSDFAPGDDAWKHALRAAARWQPINYSMNRELGAARKAQPLESRLDDLRKVVPGNSSVIAFSADPRPREMSAYFATKVGAALHDVPQAGHFAWLDQPRLFREVLLAALNIAD